MPGGSRVTVEPFLSLPGQWTEYTTVVGSENPGVSPLEMEGRGQPLPRPPQGHRLLLENGSHPPPPSHARGSSWCRKPFAGKHSNQ